ncbi:MAG: glycosyltransferase family 2 protein, partial [Planctomycetia bacterium]
MSTLEREPRNHIDGRTDGSPAEDSSLDGAFLPFVPRDADRPTLISVVAAAFNEEDCLAEFVARTDAVLRRLDAAYEIVIVNDGSRDGTLGLALTLADRCPHLRVVNLSRNFGHETASSAGLAAARGDAVVLMDSDLQDPPELIPELVDRWLDGYDVVYAQRRTRDGETRF